MPADLSHVAYKYAFKHVFRGNVQLLQLLSPRFLYKCIVGSEHYDIVVSYLQSPVMRIATGCQDKNTKLVNWIHNEFRSVHELSRMFRSEKEFHRSMQRYDHTVFVAESARQSLCKMLPYLTDKSSTIYNVVETDEITARSEETISDCDFNNAEFNIISAGRFSEAKAFDRLIRITKRLLGNGINAHLYLLGKGALQESYVQEAASLGISDNVTIIGFRDNPYKYVAKADLFVCSSLHEGFSTAVTESLIVGTPVVTTACSGMEELLGANGEFGIITENDEQSLGDALLKLIPDADKMRSLREATKRRAVMFSKQQTLKDNIDLFNSLA